MAVPKVVVPSMKVTVPDGGPLRVTPGGSTGVTVAVNVVVPQVPEPLTVVVVGTSRGLVGSKLLLLVVLVSPPPEIVAILVNEEAEGCTLT